MHMPDEWIGFNTCDRQKYWWRAGFLTLILAGVLVAMSLTTHGSGKWWWFGGLGAFSVVAVLNMIDLIYGQALLTATGLQFRTFVSRRVVPWSEVARIEERHRTTRSGTWCSLRVVRARGRSLTIPGTLTNRFMDAELERKHAAIQARWSREIGG